MSWLARVLCETGFKDLFSGLFNEVCENPNQQRTLKINGKWTPYDTGTFDASMGVEVNANLGKGSDMVRLLALNQIKQDQQLIFTQMGPSNPIVGIQELMNTQTDMLKLANIMNPDRYFKMPESAAVAADDVAAKKPPDPMLLAAQAQMEKVRSDTAKSVGQQKIVKGRLSSRNSFTGTGLCRRRRGPTSRRWSAPPGSQGWHRRACPIVDVGFAIDA